VKWRSRDALPVISLSPSSAHCFLVIPFVSEIYLLRAGLHGTLVGKAGGDWVEGGAADNSVRLGARRLEKQLRIALSLRRFGMTRWVHGT